MHVARLILSFILTILFVPCVLGQNQPDSLKSNQNQTNQDGWFNYVQLTGYNGQHLGDQEKKQILDGDFWGVGFRLGKQTSGKKEWQQIHAYPQYGVGISYFDLGNVHIDSMFGKPLSFYFFYGAPIARSGKFSLNADLEIGLSTAFHAYDPKSNPDQTIIGATTNLHSALSLELYYRLSRRTDIAMGLSFMHFSNGKIYTPQQGINIFGLNLSTVYHYDPHRGKRINEQKKIRPDLIKTSIDPFKPANEWSVMGSIGTVQVDPGMWKHNNGDLDTTKNVGPRYFTNSVSLDYAYHRWQKWKLAAGVDFFYDRSAIHLYPNMLPSEIKFSDKAFYGAHIGLHYCVARISAVFNYGRYIYKPFNERGKWYMRVGGRFGVAPKIEAQISLKTRNGRVADWIEWGIVYKYLEN